MTVSHKNYFSYKLHRTILSNFITLWIKFWIINLWGFCYPEALEPWPECLDHLDLTLQQNILLTHFSSGNLSSEIGHDIGHKDVTHVSIENLSSLQGAIGRNTNLRKNLVSIVEKKRKNKFAVAASSLIRILSSARTAKPVENAT